MCRNWRCPIGEIDLIMIDGGDLVFVEVKTRRSFAQHVFDTITPEKQRRLRRLAEWFIRERFRRGPQPRYRIDLVGVIWGEEVRVEHVRGAL